MPRPFAALSSPLLGRDGRYPYRRSAGRDSRRRHHRPATPGIPSYPARYWYLVSGSGSALFRESWRFPFCPRRCRGHGLHEGEDAPAPRALRHARFVSVGMATSCICRRNLPSGPRDSLAPNNPRRTGRRLPRARCAVTWSLRKPLNLANPWALQSPSAPVESDLDSVSGLLYAFAGVKPSEQPGNIRHQ